MNVSSFPLILNNQKLIKIKNNELNQNLNLLFNELSKFKYIHKPLIQNFYSHYNYYYDIFEIINFKNQKSSLVSFKCENIIISLDTIENDIIKISLSCSHKSFNVINFFSNKESEMKIFFTDKLNYKFINNNTFIINKLEKILQTISFQNSLRDIFTDISSNKSIFEISNKIHQFILNFPIDKNFLFFVSQYYTHPDILFLSLINNNFISKSWKNSNELKNDILLSIPNFNHNALSLILKSFNSLSNLNKVLSSLKIQNTKNYKI